MEDGGSKDYNREGIHNESQSTTTTTTTTTTYHCPPPNRLKQKYRKLPLCPKNPSCKASTSLKCPSFRCRQRPPCRKKACSASIPLQPVKICPPSPPPCPITISPVLLPSSLSYAGKPCPPTSPPYPSIIPKSKVEVSRDTDHSFKNANEKREKQKSKEMINHASNYGSSKFHRAIKQLKHSDTIQKEINLLEQKNNHNIVKRFANILNQSLSNINENNTNFFCNDERLKAIMLANIDENPIISKELIQRATKQEFNEDFNVICSTDTFAYVTYTETYCEVNNELITCYAFKSG